MEANLHKFEQHPDLGRQLMHTDDRRLGEATKDTTWGVGLNMWDKSVLNVSAWRGQNRQGGILEEVRLILQKREQPMDYTASTEACQPDDLQSL